MGRSYLSNENGYIDIFIVLIICSKIEKILGKKFLIILIILVILAVLML